MKLPCPQCGGEIQLQETIGFVGCPFCGTGLVLDLTGARPHLLYLPRHPETDAVPLLRRWCEAHALPGLSRVSRPSLVYRPFWRYLTRGRPRLTPAWPALETQWSDLTVPEGEQVVYDPAAVGAARVVESSVAEAAARRRLFGETADAVEAGDLVHVPFYEVQASAGGHRLGLSVDACSGRVYPDRLPPGANAAGPRRGIPTVVLGFVGMFLEAALIPSPAPAAILVGLTAVVLYWALVGAGGRTTDGEA